MKTGLELLRDLKTSYADGCVSALIGSGFSINAYPDYPGWAELLRDMATALYPAEVPGGCSKELLNAFIERKGSLNLASEYQSYRGIGHEALDFYIENHIPYVDSLDSGLCINGHKLTDDDLSVHKALLSCSRFNNIYTTNYDNLLERVRDYYDINDFKRTINSAQGLSDSIGKRSIIKIHGDMEEPGLMKYEFDGDKNLKYILAKEDYETYQAKHEPFTSLMRLTMLSGKFCLIGFSGSDPNFQGWLQWMKSVLDGDSAKNDDIKVFLILVKDELIEPDQSLFFRNHHIGVINLTEASVADEICPPRSKDGDTYEKTDKADEIDKTTKERLLNFLHYLNGGLGDNRAQPQTIKSRYNILWSDLHAKIHAKEDVSAIISQILAERKIVGVPKIVRYQDQTIRELIGKKEQWTLNEVRSFLLAIEDMGLTLSCFSNDQIKYADGLKKSENYEKLKTRELALLGENVPAEVSDEDWKIYERALSCAFSLDFQNLKVVIDNWSPTHEWQVKKASFLSLFDRENAVKLIDEYIACEDNESRKYYGSIIANAIDNSICGKYSLDKYWNEGLQGVTDIAKYIVSEARPKNEKIQRFGLQSKSICLDQSSIQFTESLRLLQYIINEGFAPTLGLTALVSAKDWYDAFVNIYESFPLPCLFYSLSVHDEKLSGRIGQEYAYSSALKDGLPSILKKLLEAIDNPLCPGTFLMSLYLISKELYCAIAENLWYDFFEKNVFVPYLDRLTPTSEIYDYAYKNITVALDNIYQPKNVKKLFTLLCKKAQVNPRIISIFICDFMNVQSLKGEKIERTLSAMSKLPAKDVYSIYYILNHHKVLSEPCRAAFEKKILAEGVSYAMNNSVAIIQLSYLLRDEASVRVLKDAILVSDVWNCGVKEKMITQSHFIEMEKLPERISWTREELDTLFENLKKNLSLIEGVSQKIFDSLLSQQFTDILYSMIFFYSKHTKFKDRLDVLARLRKELDRARGHVGMMSGFLAEDYQQYDNSKVALIAGLTTDGVAKHQLEIGLIIDRALNKRVSRLNQVLVDIAFFCDKFTDDMFKIFGRRLILLLEEYEKFDYRDLNLNLPLAYSSLLRIADKAKRYYPEEEIVDYWLVNSSIQRFNLVQYWLAHLNSLKV